MILYYIIIYSNYRKWTRYFLHGCGPGLNLHHCFMAVFWSFYIIFPSLTITITTKDTVHCYGRSCITLRLHAVSLSLSLHNPSRDRGSRAHASRGGGSRGHLHKAQEEGAQAAPGKGFGKPPRWDLSQGGQTCKEVQVGLLWTMCKHVVRSRP